MAEMKSKDQKGSLNWKRLLFMTLGITLFIIVFYSPPGQMPSTPWGSTLN